MRMVDSAFRSEENGSAPMRYCRVILRLAAVAAALWLAACSDEAHYPVRTYNMGERVDLGHIVYIVFETQWLTHVGESPDAKIPQNRFFLVRMSVTNGQSSDLILPSVSVEDDAGHSYSEISTDVGAPQWIGFLRDVKPAESAQGNVVFDAPPRHYKLKVMDETGDRVAYIDIPLSFGAETPEVSTPGSAREPSVPGIRSPDAPTNPKKQ
jgi:hypothetical protein